jgi:hypothetical protein
VKRKIKKIDMKTVNLLKIFKLFILIGIIACIISCNQSADSNPVYNYRKQISKIKTQQSFEFLYYDTAWNFTAKRGYIDDSTFVDYAIFGSCDTCLESSLSFQIKNGAWNIFDGNQWQLFYDGNKLNKVELLYLNRTVIPNKSYKLGSDALFLFTAPEKQYEMGADPNLYCFSPKYGIAAVISMAAGSYFRRKDFNPIGLDSLMKSIEN